MAALYLSRARLRTGRGEVLASLARVFVGGPRGHAVAAGHRIVWMMFQATPDAGREADWRAQPDGCGFLWRDEGGGRYLVLSRKPPTDPHGLFELDPPKEFTPALALRDRLAFVLRVNPVVATKAAFAFADQSERSEIEAGVRLRGKKVDVIMRALHGVPRTIWDEATGRAVAGGRASERERIAAEAVAGWLEGQGERHGFRLRRPPTLVGHTHVAIERRRGRPAGITVVDIAGEIEVTDPPALLTRLPLGFGSAKAFGCGLMLIRRA